MSRHLLCAFLLVATLALGNSAHAALHALVIGIDDYQHGSDLFGAVNDAKDIAAALEQTGAASVRLLLNEQAHRDAIFSAWESLKAEAKSGDTLLLSYAGHGSQEPERVPGQEQDGMDEVLLLGAYDAKAPANYQRIVDDELRKMVLDAADFEVVMVFDACHSGTLNRAVGREVRQQRSRFSNYGAITNDTLPPPPLVQEPQAGTLEYETYLAASLDSRKTPEIEIDGQQRGALSYFFAQALRGYADQDNDGTVTRAELRHYIQTNVRQLSEGRQEPTVDFSEKVKTKPLFTNPHKITAPQLEQKPLALAAINANADSVTLLQPLQDIVPVASSEQAELTWDVSAGQIISAMNDVIAHVSTQKADVLPYSEVQGVIDKWAGLSRLKKLAERSPLAITILQGNQLHHQEDIVTFSIEPRRAPYLTLLNWASTGQVQYLYPLADYNDDPRPAPDSDFTLDIEVSAPFGADHLIALTSVQHPKDLQQALQRLDQQFATKQLLDVLRTAVETKTVSQIGVLGVYTAPKS